jgi:hypothetical protein
LGNGARPINVAGTQQKSRPNLSRPRVLLAEPEAGYFFSIAPLSVLVVSVDVSFFVLDFFFILFIALIDPLLGVVALVALVWSLAGAPAVCADAAATADMPMTAAQTVVSRVFRMEASC